MTNRLWDDVYPNWNDVQWENTHIECAAGMYHFGILTTSKGRYLAIGTGKTDKKVGIIAMTDTEVDEFAALLRHTAKSL